MTFSKQLTIIEGGPPLRPSTIPLIRAVKYSTQCVSDTALYLNQCQMDMILVITFCFVYTMRQTHIYWLKLYVEWFKFGDQFFAVVIPKPFLRTYPSMEASLRLNEQKLTTWFDVHQMLSEVPSGESSPWGLDPVKYAYCASFCAFCFSQLFPDLKLETKWPEDCVQLVAGRGTQTEDLLLSSDPRSLLCLSAKQRAQRISGSRKGSVTISRVLS
jgi:Protein of unknown function (DUF229)